MGYWKLLLVSFITLIILSALSYGIAYFWYVILWRGAVLTSFHWMYTFIVILSILIATMFSKEKE